MDPTLAQFRQEKDQFFAHHEQSPLTSEQKQSFSGLAYFPDNPALLIDAPLEPATDQTEVRMPTSSGGEQVYRRAGVVRFAVDGQPAEVTLYASDHQHDLFLPFRDQTSGRESYPAGRYLEVAPAVNGRVRIDFNRAYNPFCAYNASWSCPLPPPENWLPVPIRAGEMDFPGRDTDH